MMEILHVHCLLLAPLGRIPDGLANHAVLFTLLVVRLRHVAVVGGIGSLGVLCALLLPGAGLAGSLGVGVLLWSRGVMARVGLVRLQVGLVDLRARGRVVSRVAGHGARVLHQAGALLARDGDADVTIAGRAGRGPSVGVLALVGAGADRSLLGHGAGAVGVVGGTAGLVLVEVVHVVGVLAAVAYVLLAAADTAEEPADAAAKGLDKIPDVEGVKDGSKAHEAALARLELVGDGRVAALVQVGARVVAGGGAVAGVGLVGKGPDVQERKGGHLDAEEQGGNADLDVGVGEDLVGVDNVEGRGADGNGRGLPEGEEDDELDGDNLDEEFLVGEGFLELNVELNEAEHGNGDGDGVEDNDLGGQLGLGCGRLLRRTQM